MNKKKEGEKVIFTSRGAHINCAIMAMLTLIRLEISCRTRWWCLKCVIVYLARDIPTFVMYCIYGESGSSILIESTDRMIHIITEVFPSHMYYVIKLISTIELLHLQCN